MVPKTGVLLNAIASPLEVEEMEETELVAEDDESSVAVEDESLDLVFESDSELELLADEVEEEDFLVLALHSKEP